MQSLKSELMKLKAQVADTENLKLEVTNLTTEFESLRAQAATALSLEKEVQQLRKTVAAQTQKQNQPVSSPVRTLRSASKR
jgi:cell shape-determining protein MreC